MKKYISISVLWKIFLYSMVGFICYLTIVVGGQLQSYLKLSNSVAAQIQTLRIAPLKGEKFAIKVNYSYQYKDEKFKGSEFLPQIFLNIYAAQEGCQDCKQKKWIAWVSHNGKNSKLYKEFPFGNIIRLSVSLFILGYFFVLRKNSHLSSSFCFLQNSLNSFEYSICTPGTEHIHFFPIISTT